MTNILLASLMAGLFMWESRTDARPFWLWATATLSVINCLAVLFPAT